MKPEIFFAVAIGVIAVVAVVLLVSVSSVPVDAKSILNASTVKVAVLGTYDISYNIMNVVVMGSESLVMPGVMRVTRGEGGERTYMKMSSKGTDSMYDIYDLDSGKFSCSTGFSGVSCERSNQTAITTPVGHASQLAKLWSFGLIDVRSTAGRTVIGRQTECVIAEYNVAKIAANASLSESLVAGIKSMISTACFDEETGLPLFDETEIKAEVETSAVMTMTMIATSVSLAEQNVALPSGATIY